jgi:hypothetical protein
VGYIVPLVGYAAVALYGLLERRKDVDALEAAHLA